jgi:hypothetical protein
MKLGARKLPIVVAVGLALALTGCGDSDKSPASSTPAPGSAEAIQLQKALARSDAEIDSLLADYKKAPAKSDPLDSERQIKALKKVRESCPSHLSSQDHTLSVEDIEDSCNYQYESAVESVQKQQKTVSAAYPACLKKVKDSQNIAERQKLLTGCASIPH